jgi:predicted ABC-type sugar transport system permease subunit
MCVCVCACVCVCVCVCVRVRVFVYMFSSSVKCDRSAGIKLANKVFRTYNDDKMVLGSNGCDVRE